MVLLALARVSLLVLFAAPTACGPLPAEERGAALARDPALSVSPSNVFACTTCHAVSDSSDNRILPGYPLRGALNRPRFWNGALQYGLDAVNQCLVDFMRGVALTSDDDNGRALLAYLRTLAPAGGTDPARPCSIVRNIDPTYLMQLPPGDATRGTTTYQRACGYCHGSAHTGAGRLGPHVSNPSRSHPGRVWRRPDSRHPHRKSTPRSLLRNLGRDAVLLHRSPT
ncbi:MAG: cytochrome C oxidase Cbb3 [Verrucomicrobiota bacterium]